MSAMASQITSLTIVYLTVYSGADQRKLQSSASLAFVRGIHRWPVNSTRKGPVARIMFPFHGVIMVVCKTPGHFVWITQTISSVPLCPHPAFQNFQIASCMMNLPFILDGCHHSLAAAVPIQYGCDSHDIHCSDVIMSSPVTGVSVIYSNVCSGTNQRKHQSSASLAFVRGWASDAEMSPFDDVIMNMCIPKSITSLMEK